MILLSRLFACLLILVTIPVFVSQTFAQEKKEIIGLILDQSGNAPLRMASITNITLGKTTVSSSNGTFEIMAGKGNILAFSANGYYADTLTLTSDRFSKSNLILTLKPLPATLANVTVLGKYSQYQVDSIERRKEFTKVVGTTEMPTVSRANDLGFGVGINLDKFSKREREKQKARDLFSIAEQEAYVNWRWNEEIVVKYTRLEGDKLIDFMERYRPDYHWLRKNPEEKEIMYYINTALKKEKRRNPVF
jgi:hypothetical protein